MNATEVTMTKPEEGTMDRNTVSAESALCTIDDAQLRVASVVDELARLVADLRELLPAGPAADVTRPIEDLSRRLRDAITENRVERVRGAIMDHGVPLDEVACAACGSADFSDVGCQSCATERSDGLRLARRLAGWSV